MESKQYLYRQRREGGFSLVEVILAIGVFSLTIIAVIGLLGPIAQQVRDLQDTKVANNLPAPIREELNRIGFINFVDIEAGAATLVIDGSTFPETDDEGNRYLALYAPMDGSRAVVQEAAGVNPNADTPDFGVEVQDRYYEIRIFPAAGNNNAPGNNLRYNDGDAHVAFRVQITWPFTLPDGNVVDEENRRDFEYFTAIVAGEPF
jgi:hypothetical protein